MMFTTHKCFFVLIAFHFLACKHEALPNNPPKEAAKTNEAPCVGEQDCLHKSNELKEKDPEGSQEATTRDATAKEENKAKEEADKRAAEEAAKKAEKPSPLPGANLTVGSLTADGLELKDVVCKTEGRVGLLGTLVVVSGLSKQKDKLDACHKGQIETQVHFWQSSGKISKAEALGADAKVNKCVEKAVIGAPSSMDSECFATIIHGK
jgi:hypothetical protein